MTVLEILPQPSDPLGGAKVKYLNLEITQSVVTIVLLKFRMQTEVQ